MTELIKYLLAALGGGSSLLAIIIVLLVFFPEKVDKWIALLLRALNSIKALSKYVNKQYVKRDLQGRVNEYTKRVSKEAPYLASTRVEVQYVDGDSIKQKGVFEDGKVFLRLRRDDPEEMNFVHGAYMLVSTALLFKAKRYLSPAHGQAADLYVTKELLRREKASTVGLFLEHYLHPKLGKKNKTAQYFDAFAKIDQGGLFFPVLLQELHFLGEKVFGGRKYARIVTEVNDAIAFLQGVVGRKIGEEVPLQFDNEYCRFAFVIVGKPSRLAHGEDIYINYINEHIPEGIETLYLIGVQENKESIDKVCSALADTYEKYRTHSSKVVLTYDDDGEIRKEDREQYLVILRKRGIDVYQPSG